MKKLFVIIVLMALGMSANAQDVYSVGYYNVNNGTIAALYKNNERLYTAHITGLTCKAARVACNSQGDVFWLVNYYDDLSNTFSHSEIRLEDMVYASTENHGNIHISDLYCLNNTVYYAGYQYNEDSVMVATVWKGSDFTEHWVLGDGVHPSCINDVEVDKQTSIPYFCGYVIDGKKKASVWENQDLLFSFDQDSINSSVEITYSEATQIAVENGHVYTLGIYEVEGAVTQDAIWKDNTIVLSVGPYYEFLQSICAMGDSYYYGYSSRDQLYTSVLKSDHSEMLRLNNIGKMLSSDTDIYVLGKDFDSHFCVWKNFEELFQIENCNAVYDMTVHETSVIPDDYYGFLYQPNTAIIYLSPNHPYEVDNNQLYAGFQYRPNGLLEKSYVETYEMYGHWRYYYYDSDLHVIVEDDSYFNPVAAPFQNQYSYEDGLLMTYTRYFFNYHADDMMILEDSISYSYDELRRLQTEKRFKSTTYEKTYEYHENEVIITTDGYSSDTWMTLSQETRTFSEDSLLLSSKTEKYNDSATLVTYTYDEQGNRLSALTQKRNNGVWENQKLVQYHFNPNGHLTLAEIKLWQESEWVDAHRAIYDLDEMGYPAVVTFEKWDGEAWVNGVWQADFYLYNEDHLKQQNDMLFKYKNYIHKIEMDYLITDNPEQPLLPDNSEWFYEILNDDGSVTYQHLEYAADTTIGTQRPKIIIRSNTQYDRDTIITEVTHEYIYEENGIVYWWNKDLEAFTMLYDLMADVGDEWEIKVGTDSLTMHVDAVENYEYGGKTYRVLRVSDENGFFSGDIVSGIGHLTSFFPERLMNRGKSYRVTGLRCYWVEGNLVFKINRDDCDAIYAELHNGIEEDGPSTGSGTFVVYPNPASNILFVQTLRATSLPAETYRITNLMGQTVLSGNITSENQQINIEKLPAGIYFISVNEQTVKFVVK